jgi:hypothetical protein
MNKNALFQELRELKIQMILELKENVRTAHDTVDIDESETIDLEDLSHQFEGGEMEQLFKEQLKRAEEDLLALKGLDIAIKDHAVPGSVVFTENFNFIIGIPALPFQFENTQFVGISTESAIFQEMKGKRSGEMFSHASNIYTISKII